MRLFKAFLACLLVCCVWSVSNNTVTEVYAEGSVAMYRLYNPNSGEHFYTADVEERNHLTFIGWNYEGVGWYAPSGSNTPVYRMYNPYSGDHHYTTNASERDNLVAIGWNYEGVGWYSDDAQTVAMYRQFNPNVSIGTHNYTSDSSENDHLVSIGWNAEGIGWYAVSQGETLSANSSFVTPPYYSQLDARWSSQRYNGHSIGYTGCGVCCIAMILSARLGRSIYPSEVAQVLCNAGEYNNGDVTYGGLGTTGNARLVAGSYYGVPCTTIGMYDYDGFVNALASGKLISMMSTGAPFTYSGSHGIVIYGYYDGVTHVYDPYTSSNNGEYSIQDIWNYRSFNGEDLDVGTTVFAF